MKHFLSIIKKVAICASGLLFYNCTEPHQTVEPVVYKGDFRLSEEARSYVIKDTVTTSFKMIDNNNITDQFVRPAIDRKYLWINKYSYGSYEYFGLGFRSLLNNYEFDYSLYAGEQSSVLTMYIWLGGSSTIFTYDFSSKTIAAYSGDPIPDVKFYDEMEVRGIVYHKIIEVDYSKDQAKLQSSFPVHMFYSAEKGLIKFIRKDGIYFERI